MFNVTLVNCCNTIFALHDIIWDTSHCLVSQVIANCLVSVCIRTSSTTMMTFCICQECTQIKIFVMLISFLDSHWFSLVICWFYLFSGKSLSCCHLHIIEVQIGKYLCLRYFHYFMHPVICLSTYLPTCSSVWNNVTSLILKDLKYQTEIWFGCAQYHEADPYIKQPCMTKFGGGHAPKITKIGLKFGRVAHTSMKQIIVLTCHVQPIFACSTELSNFPCLAWIRSERQHRLSLRISYLSLKFYKVIHSSMKQMTMKNGHASAIFVLSDANQLSSPVDSPHKGPVTWRFDFFPGISFNKLLNKQCGCWWLETPWCSRDIIVMSKIFLLTVLRSVDLSAFRF